MIKNVVLALMLGSLAANAGYCASENAPQKLRLKVVSVIAQDEIGAQMTPSTGGANAGAQYGLIGALVGGVIDANADKKRAAQVESAVAKYRDMLVKFDFRKPYQDAIKAALEKSSVYDVTEYVSSSNAQDAEQKPNTKEAPIAERQLLVLDAHYSLSPDFSTLYLIISGAVYGPSPAKTAPYVKRKFNMVYQGESRLEGFALSTPELKAAELAGIEARYEKLIAETPDKQSSLVSKKKSEIKKAEKENYVRFDPKLIRDEWNQERLSTAISKGIDAVSAAMVGELERQLTDKSKAVLKKQSEKIPVISGLSQATFPAYSPGYEKAIRVPNQENSGNGLSQYFFISLFDGSKVQSDVLYIAPSTDLVKTPILN